jgi:hypothetical protein
MRNGGGGALTGGLSKTGGLDESRIPAAHRGQVHSHGTANSGCQMWEWACPRWVIPLCATPLCAAGKTQLIA